jgi:phosphatidate cytidylyltransferase
MTVESLSRLLRVSESGLAALGIMAVVLGGAAVLRWTAERRRPDDETRRAWRSVGTWWALFGLLLVVLLSGRIGALIISALISLVLLTETLRLVDGKGLFPLLALAGALLYVWAWADWVTVYTRLLPLIVVAILAWEVVVRAGLLSDVLPHRPMAHYPILIAMIGPAYAYGVAALPAPPQIPESEMGWFLLLIVLTELNDMAQSWWGRALGRRRLAPVLSPGKTWEGFLGGWATTAAAALVLCPTFTSWGRAQPPVLDQRADLDPTLPAWIWSLGLGLTIGLVGLAGDLAASALKRRAGLKDSGTLLPGHGGLLDRFDSMTATAPVFFLITWTFWFSTP